METNPYDSPVTLQPGQVPRWRRLLGMGCYAVAAVPTLIGCCALRGVFVWTAIERRQGITEHRLSYALMLLVGICFIGIALLVWVGRWLRRATAGFYRGSEGFDGR